MLCCGVLQTMAAHAKAAAVGPAATAAAVAMLASRHMHSEQQCSWLLGADSRLQLMRS
jgi:ApbE superfamily uncharacterized protein (UPF0280 family)